MILLLQLSKIFTSTLLLILFCLTNFSYGEPKDIWKKSKEINIQKSEDKKVIEDNNLNKDLPATVFDKGKLNLGINKINQSDKINDNEIIFGLYEPQETKISLNIWSIIDQNTYDRFKKNLLLFYTGINRQADQILKKITRLINLMLIPFSFP